MAIYLISENSLEQAKNYPKEQIVLFKENYIPSVDFKYKTITSAQIAKDILEKTIHKKIGTNSKKKAKLICPTIEDDFELYLLYSEKINEINLEKKTLLIIENNSQLNKIDAQKIYLLPPWPIVIEKIRKEYPNQKIKTITQEDELLFNTKEYFKNLQMK